MSAVFEQVMAQCTRGCFTGLLRIRTRDGDGEIRFLSGIQDGVRFDSVEGDAALERLLSANEPEFEAIASLPPIDLNSSEPVPPEGGLHTFHAAQLMRYCESYSLTCALELEVEGKVLTARYRLGELLSVEPDSEHTSKLAEAKRGIYRFRLPRFELPASVARPQPAAPKAAAPAPKAATPKPATATPKAATPKPATPAPKAAAAKPVATASKAAATPRPAAPSITPAARVGASPAKAAPVVQNKIAPTAILTPKAAPSAPRVPSPAATPAAPAPMRPAAPATAVHGAAPASPAVSLQRSAPAPERPAAEASAAATARGMRPTAPVSLENIPEKPSARSVAAQAAPSPQEAPAPLKGLWVDAVSPPAQAAPLELNAVSSGESLRPDTVNAPRSSSSSPSFGGNGSLPSVAPGSRPGPAHASQQADASLDASFRKPSAARYLWLLVVVAVAVGAWIALGRPLP